MASRLKPGDVIGFIGELGSGKTTIIQFIAKFLGVKKNITSPTYLYLKTYPLKNGSELIHCDAYRLDNDTDVNSIDLAYYFNKNNIILIEWADKIIKFLPNNVQIFNIKTDNKKRIIEKIKI